MAFRIEFKPAAFRDLAKLPKPVQKRIISRVDTLTENPFPPGVKKLTTEEDLYRTRVGDHRVVYQVRGDILLVLIVRVGTFVRYTIGFRCRNLT